jgi:hypothetical protein
MLEYIEVGDDHFFPFHLMSFNQPLQLILCSQILIFHITNLPQKNKSYPKAEHPAYDGNLTLWREDETTVHPRGSQNGNKREQTY